MEVIKLSATDSTNAHLRRLMDRGAAADGTVVVAAVQTAGKGQRGNLWHAEAGKNLTFSLLKEFEGFPARRHFDLNMAVSMAILEELDALGISGLRVKWPNDILSGGRKICGILIENTMSGHRILKSVIGIGLNVNQGQFEGLPRAGSLFTVSGRSFDTDALLQGLLAAIAKRLARLEPLPGNRLRSEYESKLFGKDQEARFALPDQPPFKATIRGVTEQGRLRLDGPDGLRKFGFGEIEMLY